MIDLRSNGLVLTCTIAFQKCLIVVENMYVEEVI